VGVEHVEVAERGTVRHRARDVERAAGSVFGNLVGTDLVAEVGVIDQPVAVRCAVDAGRLDILALGVGEPLHAPDQRVVDVVEVAIGAGADEHSCGQRTRGDGTALHSDSGNNGGESLR
jgi:hypothetical protein